VNLTSWLKRNAGPMIVGAVFVVFGALLFGIKIIVDQGADLKSLAAQGEARDRAAAEQRMLQHECSLPAQPGQHTPEPKVHVHKCWNEGLGAIIGSMQRAVDAAEGTSKFIAGCLDPKGECGKLTAEREAKEQAALQSKLDTLKAQVNVASEELLRRTTFVVTNPDRPGDTPLVIRPVIAPAQCQALAGIGEVEIGQGLLCSDK
jgi:hypothetical protein